MQEEKHDEPSPRLERTDLPTKAPIRSTTNTEFGPEGHGDENEDPDDNDPEPPFNKDPTNPRIPTTPTPVALKSSARYSMPLHGNPDVSQLADRTNLDRDLKGDPKAEQFNPISLTHTEIAKPDRTHTRHSVSPTTSTPKKQSYTDRKNRTLGHSM